MFVNPRVAHALGSSVPQISLHGVCDKAKNFRQFQAFLEKVAGAALKKNVRNFFVDVLLRFMWASAASVSWQPPVADVQKIFAEIVAGERLADLFSDTTRAASYREQVSQHPDHYDHKYNGSEQVACGCPDGR